MEESRTQKSYSQTTSARCAYPKTRQDTDKAERACLRVRVKIMKRDKVRVRVEVRVKVRITSYPCERGGSLALASNLKERKGLEFLLGVRLRFFVRARVEVGLRLGLGLGLELGCS